MDEELMVRSPTSGVGVTAQSDEARKVVISKYVHPFPARQ